MPYRNQLIPCCLLLLVPFAPGAQCQSADRPATDDEAAVKLADLLLEVRKSNYDPVTSHEAIPDLQKAFTDATNSLTKENIASVLVTLGNKDEVYWSVLFKRAQEIVDSKAPYPLVYDTSGKSIRGSFSPEFLEWVKTNNLSQDEALNDQIGTFPAELSLMATTGDPRGRPILRAGLSSPNYEVRAAAGEGLAMLQDKASIPLIIEAARKAPSEAEAWIARPLVSFGDPRARAAAEELIPDKALLAELKQRAKEKGPRGLW